MNDSIRCKSNFFFLMILSSILSLDISTIEL